MTSTLHAYFEGRKTLFSGLPVKKLETEWEACPVLHFDMNLEKIGQKWCKLLLLDMMHESRHQF